MNKFSTLAILVAVALTGCNSGSGNSSSSSQKSSGQTYKIADASFDASKLDELTYSVELPVDMGGALKIKTLTHKFSSYSNNELASLIQKSIDEEKSQEDKAELESLQKAFNKLDNEGKSGFFNINETHHDLDGKQIGEGEDSLYFTSILSEHNSEFIFELDVNPSLSTEQNINNIYEAPEFIVKGNDFLKKTIKTSSKLETTARLIDFSEITSKLWQGAGPNLGSLGDQCTLTYTTNWDTFNKTIESIKVGKDRIETIKIVSGDTYSFSCQSYRGETKTANQNVRKTVWYNPVFGNVKVNEMISLDDQKTKSEDTVLTSFKLK